MCCTNQIELTGNRCLDCNDIYILEEIIQLNLDAQVADKLYTNDCNLYVCALAAPSCFGLIRIHFGRLR